MFPRLKASSYVIHCHIMTQAMNKFSRCEPVKNKFTVISEHEVATVCYIPQMLSNALNKAKFKVLYCIVVLRPR